MDESLQDRAEGAAASGARKQVAAAVQAVRDESSLTISTRAGGEGPAQAGPGPRSFTQVSRGLGDAICSPLSPETARALGKQLWAGSVTPDTLTERLPLTVTQSRTPPGLFLNTSASPFSRQLETEQRPRKEPR